MTLREKICASGVTTLREYMCVETGGTDEIIYVPTDHYEVDVRGEDMEINVEETSILVDLEESDVLTTYVNVHTAYK